MNVEPAETVGLSRPARRSGWISGRRSPRPNGRRDLRAVVRRLLPPVLFALVVLAVWQVSGLPQSSLPRPTRIAQAMWQDRGVLSSAGWTTLEEVLLGYLVAVVLGVALAVLVSMSRVAERALYPWLVISQTVPIPAIAPLFVVWFGFDLRPKLLLIALVAFFPIVVNTVDGLRSADPELLNLLRTLGARRWRRLRVAQLPASLPFLFSGLKVAAVFSVIGAVFAEWVGSSDGLGYLILTYNQQADTTDMFAAITVLAAIGLLLFLVVSGLERLALPWYHSSAR